MTNLPKHPQHCQAGRRSFNPVGLLHELGPKKRIKMVAFTIIHHYLGETCNLSTRFINPRLTLKQKDDCLHVWFQPIPKSGHTPPATSQGQGGSDGYTHCPIYIDTCIHIISMENMLKVCIYIYVYVYVYVCTNSVYNYSIHCRHTNTEQTTNQLSSNGRFLLPKSSRFEIAITFPSEVYVCLNFYQI